ncbi:MAG: glycosyltransferase family 2 protein [Gemmatimonadetes bacterium]|nr:glycosyltransferase family 2 protein [Gemmatimonadota bacterium]
MSLRFPRRRKRTPGEVTVRQLRLLAVGLLVGLAWPLVVLATQGGNGVGPRPWFITVMVWALGTIVTFVVIYLLRHYFFTLNRLFGRQRYPYLDVDTADWPEITVMIPCHNEEKVIHRILTALLEVDYPRDRLKILPINDRSEDRTGEIIDDFADRHLHTVTPFHRTEGRGGKGAALRAAMPEVQTDVILVFDADYVPGRGLIKQLVAPFFDPEVGAVMGRVIPSNVDHSLLTRLLDLERSGGYQVDQQARMNLRLVPQYGGTVGGVRKSALDSVGGWSEDTLAEDTDATYRLLLGGWKTVYQNRSECYEEVPQTWDGRMNQVLRWARGHNQTMTRYLFPLLRNRRTGFWEKVDGTLLLGVYMMSPVLLVGWTLAMVLWYLGENRPGLLIVLAVASYSTIGNFATFFEVAAATHLDGTRERARLIPFILLGFLVTILSVTRGTLSQLLPQHPERALRWHKTERNGGPS